jgi:hypothetical protein
MSAITNRTYMPAVREFAQVFNTPPDRLGLEHVREHQARLFTDCKLEALSVVQQLYVLRLVALWAGFTGCIQTEICLLRAFAFPNLSTQMEGAHTVP